MILSFHCDDTRALFETGKSRRFSAIAVVAARKLGHLGAACELRDLRSPPSNLLEARKVDRIGQHSIRINDQFRICFVWNGQHEEHDEIVDYH